MNKLNYVLIEGKVIDTPIADSFTIEAKKDNATYHIPIDIRTPGMKSPKIGDDVRVVGYLANYQDTVFIVAEHLEIKYSLGTRNIMDIEER